MESIPRIIDYYVDGNGKKPFIEWLEGLEINTRARIRVRLRKVEGGNLGDHHSEGSGVWVLIYDFGPGYRVYYGLTDEQKIVLLISGGDKKRQNQDIQQAIEYWEDYKAQKAKEKKK